MEKILDIAFSGFWQFIGMAILINLVLYFLVNGIVRIFLSIASIFNNNIDFKEEQNKNENSN